MPTDSGLRTGWTTLLTCLVAHGVAATTSASATAAATGPATAASKEIRAVRAPGNIVIDGRLHEQAWQRPGATDFTQLNPDEGTPPTQVTEVWVAYDDEALYVAARLHDREPDLIVRRLGRRDSDLDSDELAVGIDAYHDHRDGFLFIAWASGQQTDGTLEGDVGFDTSWDGVWDSAVAFEEAAWTVEMRIPFSQLRFPEQLDATWGITFQRYTSRNKEKDVFTYVPKTENGFVSRFAHLVGLHGIQPPTRLEIIPYALGGGVFSNDVEPGDPLGRGRHAEWSLGGDVRLGLGSNASLCAAVNPDFGQVEIDPAVVNLSQYETYLEEKRPLFVEGASYFSFGGGATSNWGFNFPTAPELFYSRRIGRPPQGSVQHDGAADVPTATRILGAAKLTGRVGDGWKLGALEAVTERTYATVVDGDARHADVVEPLTSYSLARGLYEFAEGRHALGFIATGVVRQLDAPYLRDELNSKAFTAGVDGWATLDEEGAWRLTGWAVGSRVAGSTTRMTELQQSPTHYYQRPDADYVEVDPDVTSLSGYAARLAINKETGNFYLNAALGAMSPGLDTNDLGILSRGDRVGGHLVTGYTSYEVGDAFRYKSLNVGGYYTQTYGNERTGAGAMLFWNLELLSYWSFSGDVGVYADSLSPTATRGGPTVVSPRGAELYVSASSPSGRLVVVSGSASAGADIAGYASLTPSISVEVTPLPNLSISLTPRVNLSVTPDQWVDNIDDPTAVSTYNTRYVFGRLDQTEYQAELRVDWVFTPTLSFQLYLQPFLSAGRFSDMKELARLGSHDFNLYGRDAGSTITATADGYSVDPDGPGTAAPFEISTQDFRVASVRGTALLRWEFLPGSTAFLVWTMRQGDESQQGDVRFGRDLSALMSGKHEHVVMLKVSYWLSVD